MSLDPMELFPEIPNIYEFPSVHSDMIYDEHRVNAYERAIRAVVKPGDTVVDVGTGTGLLSFLALQCGAKKVHAIDRSPVIDWAKQLARANGFEDRMEFHNADSREVEISEKADVLVSELIGHIAFEEGMAEALFDAKSRFLKSDGAMIPKSVTLNAAPVAERLVQASAIDIWQTVLGIDYSPMREYAVQTSYITDIQERDLVSQHKPLFCADFERGVFPNVRTRETFRVNRRAVVNGVALWFDANLTDSVFLSSGPRAKTHWRQCFIPIRTPMTVNQNDNLLVDVVLRFRNAESDDFFCSASVRKEIESASSQSYNEKKTTK